MLLAGRCTSSRTHGRGPRAARPGRGRVPAGLEEPAHPSEETADRVSRVLAVPAAQRPRSPPGRPRDAHSLAAHPRCAGSRAPASRRCPRASPAASAISRPLRTSVRRAAHLPWLRPIQLRTLVERPVWLGVGLLGVGCGSDELRHVRRLSRLSSRIRPGFLLLIRSWRPHSARKRLPLTGRAASGRSRPRSNGASGSSIERRSRSGPRTPTASMSARRVPGWPAAETGQRH